MSTNMKKARLLAGLSQKQVALILKVSTATVSDWESGNQRPTVANLIRLCALYNVSPNYLLSMGDNLLTLYMKKRRGNRAVSDFASDCNVDPSVIEELESPDSITRANHIPYIAHVLDVDENYLFCLLDHVNPHRVTNVKIPADDVYLDLMEPGDISHALEFNPPNHVYDLPLSASEADLVQTFHDLDPMQQGQVIGYMQGLLDSQPNALTIQHTGKKTSAG